MRRRTVVGFRSGHVARATLSVAVAVGALSAGLYGAVATAHATVVSPTSPTQGDLSPHGGLAGDVYSMSATGITGNQATGGPGNIAVASFTWAASGATTCATCASGSSAVKPLVVTRLVDKASPQFFTDCAKGRVISSVTVYVTPSRYSGSTGARKDSLAITLTRVKVASDVWSGGATKTPTETLTLSFLFYAISYSPAPRPTTTSTTTTPAG